VVKYLGFNKLYVDFHKLPGVNPKYLTTAILSGVLLGDIAFGNRHGRAKINNIGCSSIRISGRTR
jgi:hypothetical protein